MKAEEKRLRDEYKVLKGVEGDAQAPATLNTRKSKLMELQKLMEVQDMAAREITLKEEFAKLKDKEKLAEGRRASEGITEATDAVF